MQFGLTRLLGLTQILFAVDVITLIVILGVSGLVKPRHDRHSLVILA